MPVVVGAARSGPPPPAPSIYKKAICLPSCDQHGRAAYPVNCVSFLAPEPSALTVQSCFCSDASSTPVRLAPRTSPALEKNASVLESGAQAGLASTLSPVVARLTNVAAEFSDVPRTYVCLAVVAAVDCTHATFLPSGEIAMSP